MVMYLFALGNLFWGISTYPSGFAVANFVIAGVLIGMETMDRINTRAVDEFLNEHKC